MAAPVIKMMTGDRGEMVLRPCFVRKAEEQRVAGVAQRDRLQAGGGGAVLVLGEVKNTLQ